MDRYIRNKQHIIKFNTNKSRLEKIKQKYLAQFEEKKFNKSNIQKIKQQQNPKDLTKLMLQRNISKLITDYSLISKLILSLQNIQMFHFSLLSP